VSEDYITGWKQREQSHYIPSSKFITSQLCTLFIFWQKGDTDTRQYERETATMRSDTCIRRYRPVDKKLKKEVKERRTLKIFGHRRNRKKEMCKKGRT
jgi:hypothetical protein